MPLIRYRRACVCGPIGKHLLQCALSWVRPLQADPFEIHARCIYPGESLASTAQHPQLSNANFRNQNPLKLLVLQEIVLWWIHTLSFPSNNPFKDKKLETWELNPPIDPSSTVTRTSCPCASCLTNSPSSGLQNRASATVVEMPSILSSSAAFKQLFTIVP